MDDFYQILGVPKSATADEIKKAYRDAAKKYHPDANPGNAAAEEMFKKINAAYSVLGDETKRAQYDRYGSADERPQQTYQRTYQQQTYADYDPFEEFFGSGWKDAWKNQNTSQQNENPYNQHQYSYNWNSSQKLSKKAAFSLLAKNLLKVLLALYFFRAAMVIFPFGLIIEIYVLVNSISGIIRSIKALFNFTNNE
ncbi:MAG: DnaJ domain-containing protein [Treponemataceae bacterium]|nr:DnaJ domain-containing protein [Treponemataceae bacterium]